MAPVEPADHYKRDDEMQGRVVIPGNLGECDVRIDHLVEPHLGRPPALDVVDQSTIVHCQRMVATHRDPSARIGKITEDQQTQLDEQAGPGEGLPAAAMRPCLQRCHDLLNLPIGVSRAPVSRSAATTSTLVNAPATSATQKSPSATAGSCTRNPGPRSRFLPWNRTVVSPGPTCSPIAIAHDPPALPRHPPRSGELSTRELLNTARSCPAGSNSSSTVRPSG